MKFSSGLVQIINKIYNAFAYGIAEVRAFFWGLFLKKIGKQVEIMDGVMITSPQNVEIGHNVLLNRGVKIIGQFGVTIGNNVLVGFNTILVTVNHGYKDSNLPIKAQDFIGGPIVIEDNVWIGANVVVLPNKRIGRGAIVGANAVVTKNVAPDTIVGGVPAKIIKHRPAVHA